MSETTWTLVDGYTASGYADSIVFEVNGDTKKLTNITGQALVAGEENSQYIVFTMSKYWDGIDISGMTFNIMYELNDTYFGTSQAVSLESSSDDMLRFGWIVPAEACAVKGTLLFVIVITDTDYTLKTQIATHSVSGTISEDDVVPEPTSAAWYIDFQTRVDAAIDEAEITLAQAQTAIEVARAYVGAPLKADTAADMTDTNRIYVYVGSEDGYSYGYWYYYSSDQSDWLPGGVYNAVAVATDSTLTQEGVPADAKATGDAVSQLSADITAIDSVLFTDVDFWDAINADNVPDGQYGSGYYYTNGKYTNSSQYSWVSYYCETSTEIYATSPWTTAILNEYSSSEFGATTLVRATSKQADGLPTQDNPWTIPAGHWVVFSHKSSQHTAIIYVKTTQKSVKKPYSGKTWAAVGDSWTAVNSYASVRYFDYIAEELGFTVGNYGVSGTGYQQDGGTSNKEFYNRVSNLGTPDVVTIFGSGNDCVSTMVIGEVTDETPDTICGAINYTISQYLTAYPNVPLGIIAPAPWMHDGFYPANPNSRMTLYVNAMQAVCERRGVPFLDLYRKSSLFPEIESNRSADDKVYYNTNHINDRGQKLLYPKIREFLKTLI